ncbi:hypothetical protein [Pseudomonas sp. 5P_3.1_Bac2]|uniref:hypothetical protein n=1 Tax=Pseudomonas sp. 5P_3.1_Bac2 TaxID=2971617 RepID=UPI0021C9A648|nr:hypothetical protein [Pseudomonas sp. 5P_3.1_Bac2]MCU1717713.1 hypothetical protein [Pseudomonas sp. 5P_3.1_Bac2]
MFSEKMLLLTYTPRADAESRGYNPWLREIDTPFFNSVKKIAHYGNWKVTPPSANRVDWTHFDFMHLASGVEAEDILLQPDVAEFAAGWTRQWGVDPHAADLSVNYRVHKAERVRQGQIKRGGLVALILSPNPNHLPVQAEIWKITGMVLGTQEMSDTFAVMPLTYADTEIDPKWGALVLVGECIAQPGF